MVISSQVYDRSSVIKSLKKHSSIKFDVHLMISPVHKYIETIQKLEQILLQLLRSYRKFEIFNAQKKRIGKKAGVSLNPGSEISLIIII